MVSQMLSQPSSSAGGEGEFGRGAALSRASLESVAPSFARTAETVDAPSSALGERLPLATLPGAADMAGD